MQAKVVFTKSVYLFPEHNRVEHYTIANDVEDVGAENAGWDLVQHVFKTVEFKRMPGVGSSLKAGHNLILWRQYVHNFPFSFVAPLEA